MLHVMQRIMPCTAAESEHRGSAQGVDDCATMAAVFKLLDSFEGVLERPAISAQLESKLVSLLQEFNLDLQEVDAAPQPLLQPLRMPVTWGLCNFGSNSDKAMAHELAHL